MNGYTIFNNSQGCGYIHDSPKEIFTELSEEPITLAGLIIRPGEYTTLRNYFIRPLEYIGLLANCEMIFRIGSHGDLFTTKHYYQSVFKIGEDRIFEMFSRVAGRDHLYIDGVWK